MRRPEGRPSRPRRAARPLHTQLLVACLRSVAFLGASLAVGCTGSSRVTPGDPTPSAATPGAEGSAASDYPAALPLGFPAPLVPSANALTRAKIELGRYLFYDRRLSGNGSLACASCHRQELAFTDGRARALGATGELHPRSAMSLTNVAYNARLGWSDPSLDSLEAQIRVPLFNETPIEMGMRGNEASILARLANTDLYPELFARAFPSDPSPVRLENVVRALASFERILVSGNSDYDRMLFRDDRSALSPSARRGMGLFFSDELACSRCHQGLHFAGPQVAAPLATQARAFVPLRSRRNASEATPAESARGPSATAPSGARVTELDPTARLEAALYHNTALYDLGGAGAYPTPNEGLIRHTRRPEDMGRFRVPTLRNIAVTGPYMHDGSIGTLEEVVRHYAAGGRAASNPYRSAELTGFEISESEIRDLVAFLESLTDPTFLEDPRLADPFGPFDPSAPALPAPGTARPPRPER